MKIWRRITGVLLLLLVFTSAGSQVSPLSRLRQQSGLLRADTAGVNALNDIAFAYVFSFPDSGESYARRGLQLARKINYQYGEAAAFGTLCLALNYTGNYAAALDYGLRALATFSALHNSRLLIFSNIQVSICYRALEDYDRALSYARQAISLIGWPRLPRSKADSSQVSLVYTVTGSIYRARRQVVPAFAYERKALTWDPDWFGPNRNLGDLYADQGRYDSALYYYRSGIRQAVRDGQLVGQTDLYAGMAKVFAAVNQVDSSVYYASRCMGLSAEHMIPTGLLGASLQLASLYEQQHRPDSAIYYLKLAHSVKDSLFSRRMTREAQNLAFNETLRVQELAAQRDQTKNRTRTAVLVTALLIILLVAFFLVRSNRQQQRANAVLQQQKTKTEQQRRMAEQTLAELKATQAQLIQSEKMASLGELTAGIAHEIQNPLNFVNNFSEANVELLSDLKQEIAADNRGEAFALAEDVIQNEQKINYHGRRADAIVKSMLLHSRQDAGKRESTDINMLADAYLRLAYQGFRTKDKNFYAVLETHYDRRIGQLNVVPQEIGRVLLNIFNNAFYSVIQKKAMRNETYEPTVSVYTNQLEKNIEIAVHDNGLGIPRKALDKIFQPFYTTKPAGEGAGLGLSLSYEIIKGHGGELKVETKEGHYAEFIVQLPINQPV